VNITSRACTVCALPNAETCWVALHCAIVFLVIALIAAVLGFSGIAASAAAIARIPFVVFLILAIASFVVRPQPGVMTALV